MRKLVIGLSVVFACAQKQVENSYNSNSGIKSLELISHAQMKPFDELQFDLSGIVQIKDKIYVVADKKWNNSLYQIEVKQNQWYVTDQIKLPANSWLDLEAVDECDETTYFASEKEGAIYTLDKNGAFKTLDVSYDEFELSPETWGNAGWEGIAVDCAQNKLYIVKERQPRYVVTIDLIEKKAIDLFNIPETESGDFSDAKFENGFLYLLERNGNYVTKVDLKTKQVEEKYHYRDVASHPNGKLYGPTEYGMAEALLLTKNEIWIGLDNNGDSVTDHARQTYSMVGREPVILKFKRPTGF